MTQTEKLLESIKANPKNVRFSDLVKICNQYFGKPRQQGTGHMGSSQKTENKAR